MARTAITIFFSAFLLFQVQPLIAKFILPWFGGGPAVWTSCMLFFQLLLLAGYSYAHLIASRLSPRRLVIVHSVLLLGSLVCLPIIPAESWKPAAEEPPVTRIMALLGVTIGWPYFLLSATSPLLQEGYRRATGQEPYRLYALSNVGSLLALLSYPFVFEPQLRLQTQAWAWSAGYAVFALLCVWSLWSFRAAPAPRAVKSKAPIVRPAARDILLWLALATCGSVMLLASTNQLCLEVTSVPFLWVVPLSLYLLTFILCFERAGWYHRGLFLPLLAVCVALVCYGFYKGSNDQPLWQQLVTYPLTLWVSCMVCHGELARARPAAEYATLFYMVTAAGGALGGVLVAIVAPLVLSGFYEYQLGLLATVCLAFFAPQWNRTPVRWPAAVRVAGGGGVAAAIVAVAWLSMNHGASTTLESTRNFYGVLRVDYRYPADHSTGPLHRLMHGTILHGFQFMDSQKLPWATAYYGPNAGVALALEHHPRRRASNPEEQALRIGVVGLGCGTLAAWGRAGDVIRFYEIDPAVVELGDRYFTYRRNSAAKTQVVLGDARIQLEHELAAQQPQQFDVLAIDAFSSDAIPMHLLTREAVELYLNHLRPGGVLCLHITNRFLQLEAVVLGIAQALGKPCVLVASPGGAAFYGASWAIITDNFDFLNDPAISAVSESCWPKQGGPLVWTDDYGSLWQILTDRNEY